MTIDSYLLDSPVISENVFVAPDAWVIGKVNLAKDISIFFGAVLRGDINTIHVGAGSNIQEHSMLHTSRGLGDCIVGADVTVGHRAILHGCKVSDRCILGMGAILLDDAEIAEDSIVGAGTLVTMGKKFPPRSLIMGSPARFVRELNAEELQSIVASAENYRKVGKNYLNHLKSR